MFPTPVQKLIDTYAEDMRLLEELQQLKHCNSRLIRSGDARYLAFAFTPLDLTISIEDNIRRRLVVAESRFRSTPAGFVYNKIYHMEWRRLDIWIDCNELTQEFGYMGSLTLRDGTGKPIDVKDWCPFLEKFKTKFMMWRHWDEYNVCDYLDRRARQIYEESGDVEIQM